MELDLEKGLCEYDSESLVFPNIAARVYQSQRIDKFDILRILKWKLGRLKATDVNIVRPNSLNNINDAIQLAKTDGGEIEAIQKLDDVPGIGLAVASSILSICLPEKFTIIDWRVLEVLKLRPRDTRIPEDEAYSADDWTAKNYFEEFVPAIRAQSKRWGCSLRDADRALWGLSVRERIEELAGEAGLEDN